MTVDGWRGAQAQLLRSLPVKYAAARLHLHFDRLHADCGSHDVIADWLAGGCWAQL